LVIGLECRAFQLQAQLPGDICVWSVQEVGPGPEELKPGKEHLPPGPGKRLDVVEALVGGVAAGVLVRAVLGSESDQLGLMVCLPPRLALFRRPVIPLLALLRHPAILPALFVRLPTIRPALFLE
jgi:hypothetical protein